MSKEYSRKYYQAHKEQMIKDVRRWQREHKDKFYEMRKKWARTHKDKQQAICRKTRIKNHALVKALKNYRRNRYGNKCMICDRTVGLGFHHRDPKTKLFNIGSCNAQPIEQVMMELGKCDLLCSKCHAKAHRKLRAESRAFYVVQIAPFFKFSQMPLIDFAA